MIDPAKVMHKIDNDDFAINFRDAFMSNSDVNKLRNTFSDVDFKDLEVVREKLIEFFKETKIYIKIIDIPTSQLEEEVNKDSLKRIDRIARYFADNSFTKDCHYYE